MGSAVGAVLRPYVERVSWADYGIFVLFAAVLVVVPGPDVAVVVANTLGGGRRRGAWCALGVTTSNALQGTAAAAGLAAVIVGTEGLFEAIRWAGVGYLVVLGIRSLRSALRGHAAVPAAVGTPGPGSALAGWRQGFLSNITNPKVLAFYLAVLPQFLGPEPGAGALVGLALTHAVLSLGYLLGLVAALERARAVLSRRPVRRALDAITGCALLGFGARLATERL